MTEHLGVDVATVKKVLQSWGPGKYDAELNLDGKAFQPDGASSATVKDNTTAKLAALHFYQLALPAPKTPEDTYDK